MNHPMEISSSGRRFVDGSRILVVGKILVECRDRCDWLKLGFVSDASTCS